MKFKALNVIIDLPTSVEQLSYQSRVGRKCSVFLNGVEFSAVTIIQMH